MRSKFQRFIRYLPWLALGIITAHLVLGDGWKDITFGRFHRKAQEMFSDVEGVTEARIYLLMGTPEQETSETFPIRPYGRSEPICGSAVLTGDALHTFLDLWRYQSPAYYRQAMCHSPAYGFRLYRDSRLIAETSICWECSNFYVRVWALGSGWYGFDSESEVAKQLLSHCNSLLPYARPKSPENASDNQ